MGEVGGFGYDDMGDDYILTNGLCAELGGPPPYSEVYFCPSRIFYEKRRVSEPLPGPPKRAVGFLNWSTYYASYTNYIFDS